MRLIRLELVNFRQHADTAIEFAPGLTGIVGPNGAGKSTILEAIAWAIYGSPAARGTNETIRFARAGSRAPVRVELEFELGGREYRVLRTLTNAEVFVDGGGSPVATSIVGATEYLERRLGMAREEFFHTYFTSQNELQFLERMGPTERGRFLSRVLGFERLRGAQERARSRRNEIRHEADGLRSGLPDPAAIEAEVERAKERRATVVAEHEAAATEFEAARDAEEEVRPRWERVRDARETARELSERRSVAAGEAEAVARERKRIDRELDAVADAERQLAPLSERLDALPELTAECERLSELARLDERRKALGENARSLEAELRDGADRLEKLREAPDLLRRSREETDRLHAEIEPLGSEAESMREDWVARRQEVDTKLETYLDRAHELKQQLTQLREAGPDGTCPTCERPLGGEYERVVGTLRDDWERLVQDGKWLRQRGTQLEERPDALRDAETRLEGLRSRLEDANRRVVRCEEAARELVDIEEERERKKIRLDELRREIAELPGGYDAEAHARAEHRLRELREIERKSTRLEQSAGRRADLEAERREVDARADEIQDRIRATDERLADLDFSEERFEALEERYKAVAERVRGAELKLTDCRARRDAAEDAVRAACRAEAEYNERRAALDRLESELLHHDELDSAFSTLRRELNARVRPELSELASAFLAEITDGRYSALEIDDDYNVLVLDEGEEKPVISGGEEDVANLVLRLAISQMIADRAGQPFSVLVLDEVFGSLDVERRDHVLALLHGLRDRFAQVVLVTHVETIRHGLDQVVKVEYDERSGASRVKSELAA